MISRLILATVLCAQAISQCFAGVIPLSIEWERYYSYGIVFRTACPVSAGGYLLGTDATEGAGDYGIVRINSSGQKMWQTNFGGSEWDRLFAVTETADGGFLLGGQTESLPGPGKDAPRINPGFLPDAWVVRIDGEGNKLWDRAYGSEVWGKVKEIAALEDGSAILGGESSSDFWFQKIDPNGNPVWEATFGGDGLEAMLALTVITNNEMLGVGMSESLTSTSKTSVAYGRADGWMVCLDSAGRKLWDRAFGGSDDDSLFAVEGLGSNGYIIAGSSESPVSGNKESPWFGRGDAWIIRVNSNGDKLWERSLADRVKTSSL